MAITVLENYVTLDEYAALCGSSRRSVLCRIRAGTLSAIKVDGIYAVNKQISPPLKFIHHKWKKSGGVPTTLIPTGEQLSLGIT